MKKLLTVIFLFSIAHAQTTEIIGTRAELFMKNLSPAVNEIKITDSLEGGVFKRYYGNEIADSGIVVCDRSGIKFKRLISENNVVSPMWWGAKGDAVTDDLPALKKATNYLYANGGTINLGNRFYRITDSWVLGEKFIDEQYCYQSNMTKLPAFNLAKYLGAIKRKPIKIITTGYGGIYGDFTGLKAIIYYNLGGDTRSAPSSEQYAGEIINVGIYGKGSFIKGRPSLFGNNKGYTNEPTQIGIACLYTFQMKITNVTCYGLKEGIIMNNSYFSNISNTYFKLCERGLYHVQSHGSILNNLTAYFCNKGYEIRSGQMVMNNINSEQSKIGMQIVNGSNVVNGAYFESITTAGLSQLIIGDDTGEDCNGVVLNAITSGGSKPDGTQSLGVLLKKTVTTVSINGGNITGYKRDNNSSVLLLTNVYGTNPSWAYQRGKDISAEDISATGSLSVTGSINAASVTTKNLSASDLSTTGNLSLNGEIKQKTSLDNIFVKSKIVNCQIDNPDYIIELGKYSVADGTKINGTLSILGGSAYAAMGYINIVYNNLVTGYAKSSFSLSTDVKYADINLVKYSDNAGIVFCGIKVTGKSLAWSPYYFMFDGILSNNVTFQAIPTSSVNNIVPMETTESKFEILTNKLSIPSLRSKTRGVKKTLMIDENGAISTN